MSSRTSSSVDFQHLFESLPGLYLILNSKFEIIAVSTAYAQATLTQRENILDKHIFDVFPDNPSDKTATGTTNLRSSLERVLATKAADTMAVQKYDIPRPDGRGFDIKYWSPFNTPVLNKLGEVEFIIHRAEDVTDFMTLKENTSPQEKHLEVELYRRAQELQQANQKLRAAEQLKSEFLATMSHEIRTPINGILGMVEMILMSKLDPDQKEYAQVIHDSTMSLMTIINDILDFSKIEAGKIDFTVVDFSVKRILDSQSDLMSPNYKSKGLSLTTFVDPEIPSFLRGDPGRIGQVLLNLISNAVKFTLKGSIHVEAKRMKTLDSDSNNRNPVTIQFSVTDTGIGIPAKTLPQLFQSFVQGDSSTTREFGGTGLGLSISKKLVTLMNGEMGAESIESKGSCFWFSLPLLPSEGIHIEPASDSVVGQSQAKGRILVVEDNSINQKVIRSMLEKAGYSVTIASNGQEALQQLENSDYNLILMDIQMPVMDGFNATKAIRLLSDSQKNKIPIIAVTANAMKGDEEKCLQIGMNDYMSKPIQNEILLEKIQKWISKS